MPEQQSIPNLKSLGRFLNVAAVLGILFAMCIDLEAPLWVDIVLDALAALFFLIALLAHCAAIHRITIRRAGPVSSAIRIAFTLCVIVAT